ncbi:DUF3575 domain-containing protein [Adhaeribacter rhizoryzae]|uniref:DUF3575 domain-containing protein n=1 Tax=Adhaeribacter rhizoryzae TaxID=2607907 RepID=A0A5M6D2F3_9BACT|nr:DUF3575 domain-containing protein [Adhaeribacter rhizoryzae]KAA5541631.1 hypothetical protein F0145_20690 [Adhaeribacter rhizoryzae]
MRILQQSFTLLLFMLVTSAASAQEPAKPLTKSLFVKTNLLSLLAKRPTFSVEKAFSKTFSTEVSFVQGQFDNLLLTDQYKYHGLLVRAKKYFVGLDYGALSSYAAVYVGNLKRNIQTTGQVDNTGFLGYPDRNFSANSIRSGGSLGLAYFTKNKFMLDGQSSLGYGRYLNINTSDPNTYLKGYLDLQIWFSIGYCL